MQTDSLLYVNFLTFNSLKMQLPIRYSYGQPVQGTWKARIQVQMIAIKIDNNVIQMDDKFGKFA